VIGVRIPVGHPVDSSRVETLRFLRAQRKGGDGETQRHRENFTVSFFSASLCLCVSVSLRLFVPAFLCDLWPCRARRGPRLAHSATVPIEFLESSTNLVPFGERVSHPRRV
jgi:hypothetical protein